MKVNANTSGVVIESKMPKYHIYTAPTQRARNNLYVEYTIWYGNEYQNPAPSKSNLYHHTECAYYEISRCGDGEKDEKYGEQCDPGSPETSVAPNGQICNDKCEFETVPVPVCSSKYNGQVVDDLTGGNHLCSV